MDGEINPSGEINLDNPGWVQPWVQIELMNWFRVKAGKKPYSLEEVYDLETELKACDSIGQLKT